MKEFFRQLEINTAAAPNKDCFVDEATSESMTYADLDQISAKVYRYLKKRGIGREDFVLIHLPRSIQVPAAMIGIWKAGAAFVISEEDEAPERLKYKMNDCKVRCVIDRDSWKEIEKENPLPGKEEFCMHQAAYAVYTSGSTGNPKGVLLEYGSIDDTVASVAYEGKPILDENTRYPLMAPLSMAAAIQGIIQIIGCFSTAWMISGQTLKNPEKLMRFFAENQMTIAFFTPSMVKSGLIPFFRTLKTLVLSSEPASNIYVPELPIFNCYCSSETGRVACGFLVDSSYDNIPVGKSHCGKKITLADEEGRCSDELLSGEIVTETPYTRGYIGLEEENRRVFRNGWFYTGDMAKKDANGNLTIVGRKDEMIKINGNRIEPAEIEGALKEILGTREVVSVGVTIENRSFVCAYYTENLSFDPDDVREKLAQKLPYYMIPAHFIRVDSFVRLPSGKISKKNLPLPESVHTDVVEKPANEMEQRLCDAFCEVLQKNEVSVNDDFYALGGDSLSTMELIVLLDIPNLSAADIFKNRTPRRLAPLCCSEQRTNRTENEVLLKKEYPLLPYQLYMLDFQLTDAYSTTSNLPLLLEFDREKVNEVALKQATDRVLAAHPIFGTFFSVDENGDLIQKYDAEQILPTQIVYLSDSEFRKTIPTLVKAFPLFNQLLYRHAIYKTESALYLFMDMNHIISDGTSYTCLAKDLLRSLNGEELKQDHYYGYLQEVTERIDTDMPVLLSQYRSEYFSGRWSAVPRRDWNKNRGVRVWTERIVPFNNIGHTLNATVGELLILSALAALSEYNQENSVRLNWTFHGRDSVEKTEIIGLLLSSLPVALTFEKESDFFALIKNLKKQLEQGMANSWISPGTIDARPLVNDTLTLYYQHGISNTKLPAEIVNSEILFNYVDGSMNCFNVIVADLEQELRFSFVGNSAWYSQETVDTYADLMISHFEHIIKNQTICFDGNQRS